MPNDSVLVDTGALAALFDPNDRHHEACKEVAQELPAGKTFTCWPVITEASYLIRRYPQQRHSLLESVEAGEFQLLPLMSDDVAALREILAKYHDQDIDLADAALLHLANRDGIQNVFTLDRRHFNVFRTAKGKLLQLIP